MIENRDAYDSRHSPAPPAGTTWNDGKGYTDTYNIPGKSMHIPLCMDHGHKQTVCK